MNRIKNYWRLCLQNGNNLKKIIYFQITNLADDNIVGSTDIKKQQTVTNIITKISVSRIFF